MCGPAVPPTTTTHPPTLPQAQQRQNKNTQDIMSMKQQLHVKVQAVAVMVHTQLFAGGPPAVSPAGGWPRSKSACPQTTREAANDSQARTHTRPLDSGHKWMGGCNMPTPWLVNSSQQHDKTAGCRAHLLPIVTLCANTQPVGPCSMRNPFFCSMHEAKPTCAGCFGHAPCTNNQHVHAGQHNTT